MHDLRHDQEAEDAATHARLRLTPADLRTTYGDRFEDYPAGHPDTWYAASDTATVRVLSAENLRTVSPPNLRCPDCRTADDKTRAELVRLVDAVQALRLEFDVLREELRAGRL